jgi:hypothetical protein
MFCSELLLFLKKPTGMGFSPSQNFFSTSSLDINFFANFVEKNNSHGNRAKFLAAGVWN